MPLQRRWKSRLAATLISLTLVGCAQGDTTTTPAATQEVLPTPIVVIVTATPTPTLPPDRLPDTPTPVIIVVTATPSPTAPPLSTATGVPVPTPSATALPLPTQTPPTPEATATVTPVSTPTEVIIPIPTPTPTPEATAVVPPTPTSTVPATLAHVVIQTVDLGAEVVTIANLGNAPQNMTGWMLVSEVGGQSFRFPSGYTLAPGATVLVTSGPNGYLALPAVLQWLKSDGTPSSGYVWNNDGDPALLMDADGNTVSRFP
ncbi:MAG: lamin tail domain-containing protein [Chloroflexi bacterium]|nr:lamin tail domain-containing protein [Chloroflexota bacterium]